MKNFYSSLLIFIKNNQKTQKMFFNKIALKEKCEKSCTNFKKGSIQTQDIVL